MISKGVAVYCVTAVCATAVAVTAMLRSPQPQIVPTANGEGVFVVGRPGEEMVYANSNGAFVLGRMDEAKVADRQRSYQAKVQRDEEEYKREEESRDAEKAIDLTGRKNSLQPAMTNADYLMEQMRGAGKLDEFTGWKAEKVGYQAYRVTYGWTAGGEKTEFVFLAQLGNASGVAVLEAPEADSDVARAGR